MPPRTVFLVDDHPLVREGLANLIAREPDLVVCGQAADEAEALAGIAATQPKAVVVDLTLQGGSGLSLIKEIARRHPAIAVVVLTMHDEALYAERTSRAGARGYVMKQETTGRIVAALRSVLGGGTYWSDRASALLEERAAENRPAEELPAHALLSDRELEVFVLLGQGRETREIAESLEISFKTVQAYRARIKEKLGLNNATELLRAAIRFHENRLAP